jgi:hypothetical protein
MNLRSAAVRLNSMASSTRRPHRYRPNKYSVLVKLKRGGIKALGARVLLAREYSWRPTFNSEDQLGCEILPIRKSDFVRAQTGERAVTRQEYEQIHGRKYQSSICHQLWGCVDQLGWKNLSHCVNFWGDFGGNAFTDALPACLNNGNVREQCCMGKNPRAMTYPAPPAKCISRCEVTRIGSGEVASALRREGLPRYGQVAGATTPNVTPGQFDVRLLGAKQTFTADAHKCPRQSGSHPSRGSPPN